MSGLKPGLYKATVRRVPDVEVFIDSAGYGFTADYVVEWRNHDPADIADARPLIVLDLAVQGFRPSVLADYLRFEYPQLAEQIEAQTKPPRIPEPGPWGVVRSFVRGSERDASIWVRDTHGVLPWISVVSGYAPRQWADLIDPTLIRDGVS